MDMLLISIVVVLYLMLIGYLGFLGYKKTKNSDDYLVAGRSIHPFVMALSYGATFISTAAIVGFGGVAGLFGMGLLWLTFFNIFIGIFIAFVFFGKRTRKMGHNLKAHTLPELLAKRYSSDSIQKIGGLIIFISMPLYASVVLIGGSRFIENTLNVNFNVALFVFSIVIAAYVVAGGLKGVMYSDAVQGSIMFLGMSILLIATYISLGGVGEAHRLLTEMANLVPEGLQKAGHQGWTAMPIRGSTWWWTLVSTLVLGVGIGVLAQPQLIVRFMTVKSNRELNRAVLVGGIFIFMMTGVAFVVGSLSNAYFYKETGVIAIAAAGGNSDLIIPEFINKSMPPWFVYIFMLSLLAAAMSTLSSQFHNMGTAIGRDFFEKTFKTKVSSMLITRSGIVLAIIISIILGYKLPMGVVAQGTAIFFGISAATFLPSYIGALYWKKATKQAALASIFTGFFTGIFCLLFLHQKEAAAIGLSNFLFGRDVLITKFPWPVVDPILIALPVSAVVFVLVSLFTKKLEDNHIEECFKNI